MTWTKMGRGVYRLEGTDYRVMKNVAIGGWNVFNNAGPVGRFPTLKDAKAEAEEMARWEAK